MNTEDLIKTLAKREKVSKDKAKKLVKAFISSLENTLKAEKKVVFSHFGTFLTHKYPSKTIRDPQGRGHKVLMLPTNVIKWHPSPTVRKRVEKTAEENRMEADSEEIEHVKINQAKSDKSQEIAITKLDQPEDKTPKPQEIITDPKIKKPETPEPESGKDFWKETAAPDNVVPLQNPAKEPAKDTEKSAEEEPTAPTTPPPPAPAAKLTDAEISEATKSDHLPRISFEDFVKKTKNDVLPSQLEQNEEKPPAAVKLDDTSAKELVDKKPQPSNNQPFLGNVTIEFLDLSKTRVDKKVLTLIPEKFARQYQIVPLADSGTVLTVAMIDPEDLETIELIKKQTGREVIPKLTVLADLNRILDQYSGVETEVSEAITQSETEVEKSEKDKSETSKKQERVVEDAPVSRIVQSLIKRAVREQASDIHIEPAEEGLEVRFRIDGILQKKVEIPKDIQSSVISRVKILSGIKIDESRLPQDGRTQMLIDSRKVDFRVSTMPTAFGEKIVMRILDKSAGILSLEKLGLRGRGFDIVENSIHKSHGMTLVTGPTGSGKTTTLYAIIDRLLNVAVNIVTLEDPIEYQMPGINQSQVNADINYTFANGLRSILRQDPDVVMIGEIRDKETAEMAVNAALTGHVVLSTLHTNDAAGAGPRMIDMGVEPFLITSSLNTLIGQRLARKICKNCKEETKVSDKELSEVKAEIAKMPEEAQKKWQDKKLVFYKGKGCEECHNTGYKGRIGIFEVLDVDQKIQELLLARATASKITEAAVLGNMLTMKQDGIDKALDGLTSLEEVWRVTKD